MAEFRRGSKVFYSGSPGIFHYWLDRRTRLYAMIELNDDLKIVPGCMLVPRKEDAEDAHGTTKAR